MSFPPPTQWQQSTATGPWPKQDPNVSHYPSSPQISRGDSSSHSSFQPIVEDNADESRLYHGSSSRSSGYMAFPNANPRPSYANHFDQRAQAYGNGSSNSGTGSTERHFNRRSQSQFSPPPLTASGSSLTSAGSDMSLSTPPPFQEHQAYTSSSHGFSDWNARDSSAYAAQHMAPDWTAMQDTQPYDIPYDPFSPPVFTAPFSPQKSTFVRQRPSQVPSLSPHMHQTPTWSSPPKPELAQKAKTRAHHSAPLVQDVRNEPTGSPFESYMRSEINRRNVAEKTINSIRSNQAKAVARNKENARRVEWAKSVLLKFPQECALSETLSPRTMLSEVARHGAFASEPNQ